MTMNNRKAEHKDTSISLYGMTIEQALRKAVKAGPYPKKPSARRTSQRAPRRSAKAK